MSEETKDLVERLGELVKELPVSIGEVVLEGISEIGKLRNGMTDLRAQFHQQVSENAAARKISDEVTAENNLLRDRLYAAELEGARLAGYQDRVNEFDPVSEHAQYEDKLPRPRRGNDNFYDGAAMATERTPAWYHRRRA